MGRVVGTTVILLPSNIEKGIITILVFDNIDWKNKDHKGKETHNTNSILIQEIPNQCNFTRVNLNPNYDFEEASIVHLKPLKQI